MTGPTSHYGDCVSKEHPPLSVEAQKAGCVCASRAGVVGAVPASEPPHEDARVLDMIDDFGLDYMLGVVVDSVFSAARWQSKSKALEDLKRARWYLSRYIDKLEDPDA